MIVLKAVSKGFVRMAQRSGLVIWMWLLVLLAALPLAIVMEESIRDDIGASRIHQGLREGLDLGCHDRTVSGMVWARSAGSREGLGEGIYG